MPSEFALIARYFARPVRTAELGIGDDCALITAPAGLVLAVTTDALVEGTHFLPGTDPRRLGHKALAVNLSDLAAMGADPRWCLLTLALPAADEAWLEAFADGLFSLAAAHAVELIGGDTTRGPRAISVTAIGTLPPGDALRRDGASPGEDVWISGSTGDAALGLVHLRGAVKLDEAAAAHCLARLEAPSPRIALGRKLRGIATSAIDVSDGLLGDLGHIAQQSKVSMAIEYARVPQSAALRSCADQRLVAACVLAGGDDYELAFTAPQDARAAVEAAARGGGVEATRIGHVAGGDPTVHVFDARGQAMAVERTGFDHFL